MVFATQAQIGYLSTLFVDYGFTLQERKAFLLQRFGRTITFLDELTKQEASQAISELNDQKERKWNPASGVVNDYD